MKTTENKAHVEVVTASSADLAVLRASRPDDYLGATGFSRMTVYERLQWLDMAVEFVGKVAAQRGVERAGLE